MTFDIVCPIREPLRGNHRQYEDFRYAIRTWAEHLPHRHLVIVGYLPPFLDPDTVLHIPTRQNRTKFRNIGRNLQATLHHPDLTDQIVWTNQDFFILQPHTTIPLTNRGPLEQYVKGLNEWSATKKRHPAAVAFTDGMTRQLHILDKWGFPRDTPSCDMHTPIEIDRARCLDIVERAHRDDPRMERGHFRALYGAGLKSVRIPDPKQPGVNRPLPDWPFFSTYWGTWTKGKVGEQIRDTYTKASPYERKET